MTSSTRAASWTCGCARPRLFKYGSGTGSNFSRLRGEGEPLSGGGKSSGLMSFLKIGDRAAGAIKSGGTTRRAAKMVVLDLDHPDIETYRLEGNGRAKSRGAGHRLEDNSIATSTPCEICRSWEAPTTNATTPNTTRFPT